MPYLNRIHFITLFILASFILSACTTSSEDAFEWPETTNVTQPWTRWWWHGSAVNNSDISRLLQIYADAGIGGVEITPIYGVQGYEDQFIDYLTPEWMDKIEHTLSQAEQLKLGVDMATGTGWPFGGPWIGPEHAPKRLTHQIYELSAGEQLTEPIQMTQDGLIRAVRHQVSFDTLQYPVSANDHLQTMALEQVRYPISLPLLTLMAYSDQDSILNLTDRIDENDRLRWIPDAGEWTLIALFQGWHGKMVERAAPGGEGNVIDHFSAEALSRYLEQFDDAFEGRDISSLRSFFNDSYEVDDAAGQADWTPQFFNAFRRNQGYDLHLHLDDLFEEEATETHRRVLSDYRQTISELLIEEFTHPWSEWAAEHDALVRNQAHGSPANILDLYAASHIPETEGTDILRAKFATSAGHVTGKQLISAEAATWLNEHFTSALADVKRNLDRYFTAGVNHIVYHGTAFSPANAEWPGWLFYAAVHFNERNSWWDHFNALNSYVNRVQSFTQSGRAANDILLYFPVFDRFAEPGGELLEHFDGQHPRQSDDSFSRSARLLDSLGYTFDYISDRQILETTYAEEALQTAGGSYRTIFVPQCEFMPFETFQHLKELAAEGANLIFFEGLPEGVPGAWELERRQTEFHTIIDNLGIQATGQPDAHKISFGKGHLINGYDAQKTLDAADISRESMVEMGLTFHRRTYDGQFVYFITNWSGQSVRQWIPLSTESASIQMFNPQTGQSGYAAIRNNGTEVYVSLNEGESIILKCLATDKQGPRYQYVLPGKGAEQLTGKWTIDFIIGGPTRPSSMVSETLKSWPDMGVSELRTFSGTAKYNIDFPHPEIDADWYLLDLGTVHHSVVVRLNDDSVSTLIGPDYSVPIPGNTLRQRNTLEVEVANLMANRIIELDRQNVEWKIFYNINFPARLRENSDASGLFDASDWEPFPSGLLGPVTITPAITGPATISE